MKLVTLYLSLGRAVPHPLGSFDYADPQKAEIACAALEVRKTSDLLAGGNAPEMFAFTREYAEVDVKNGTRKTYSDANFGEAFAAKVPVARAKKGNK